MLPFFNKKSPPVFGVDITGTSIKLIELSRSGGRYRVEGYAVEALAPSAMAEKAIVDEHEVGGAIARAVSKAGSSAKYGVAAVAGSAVITKVINMSADLSEKDMETQIELEADQYIPFPLEEVSMDFEVLGISEADENEVEVLLAASKSENVDMRVAALELGGLEAKVIDVEAFALENAVSLIAEDLLAGGHEHVIGIVDIGSSVTAFSVLDKMKIIYSREQNFGGDQLTEDIQRQYGLSHDEAVLAKKQGGLPDGYELAVLEPFKEAMVQHINRAQQFFYSSSSVESIDHLILAGGCSSINGFAEMVGTSIDIPTTLANPFANMSLASRVPAQSLSANAPAMMIACGLALRGFD